MTDYKEILRLDALGFSKQAIADSCGCARNAVRSVLSAAQLQQITWQNSRTTSNEILRNKLFPNLNGALQYRMPGERYYGRRFTSKQELVQMMESYIRYYNIRRVQRNLGILTPMEKHYLAMAA